MEADNVDRPMHYEGDGEVDAHRAITSMLAGASAEVSWWCAGAFKYVWRAPLKGGAEDIRKARRCLEFALAAMGADEW